MNQSITGTTIQDLHSDLDVIIETSSDGEVEKAQILLELFYSRLKQELIGDLDNS